MIKNGNGHPVLKVLLVEDSRDDELFIARELSRTYKVLIKRVQTEAALVLELEQRSWDVIICDYLMPNLTPFRALEALKASVQDIPFICISGVIDEEAAVEIMRAGADDFISKGKWSRLTLAIKRQLKQSHQKLQDKLNIEEAYERTLEAWGRALEKRDHFTSGHTVRVTDMTLRLARRLGISGTALKDIHRGALLHDVGKMGIPDLILLKPDPLDQDERKIMQQHPKLAYEMLAPITFLTNALDIPYCHHEKWDGTGYPRRLKALEIPFHARIFAVCDVYDALTSERAYRRAMPVEEALSYIKDQREKYFDPKVVEAFLKMMEPA
jgi:putative two-component system response regulator